MNTRTFKIAAAALLPSVATMLFVQACGGSSDAIAQSAPDPMEGVWETVVTQHDCTTNAVTATFKGAQAMHRGGTLTDTGGGPPTLRGPGFGNWSRNPDGSYGAKFRFFRFNADGSLAGSNVVTTTRTLTADTNTYNGTTRSEVRDLTGAVLQTGCVTDVGTRFN